MVIAVTGLPGTGKTYATQLISDYLRLPVLNTDKFRDLPWDQQPDAAIQQVGPQVIVEGVTVARMLTRGFIPDVLLYLEGEGKGVRSMPWLKRNVELYERAHVATVLRMPERPIESTILDAIHHVVPDDAWAT